MSNNQYARMWAIISLSIMLVVSGSWTLAGAAMLFFNTTFTVADGNGALVLTMALLIFSVFALSMSVTLILRQLPPVPSPQ